MCILNPTVSQTALIADYNRYMAECLAYARKMRVAGDLAATTHYMREYSITRGLIPQLAAMSKPEFSAWKQAQLTAQPTTQLSLF